jgi:peptide deformylase
VALPVGQVDDRVRGLAADMLQTMYAAPGRGLAGPQVGVLRRIFVIDVTWKEAERTPRVFIDPELIDASDALHTGPEGCLSIPGVPVAVTRPAEITLRWTDLDGETRTERLTGAEAVCAQHEFDHLNGRLIIDLMDEDARAAAAPALAALSGVQGA